MNLIVEEGQAWFCWEMGESMKGRRMMFGDGRKCITKTTSKKTGRETCQKLDEITLLKQSWLAYFN